MRKCKICSGDTREIQDPKTAKIYHKCRRCDYIFLDESFYVDSEREKKNYDKHDNSFNSLGYVAMFEDLISGFILDGGKNIKTALDFGCGRGAVLSTLLKQNGVACDDYDKFYFPQKIYEDKKYDLIVSTEVVEHLSNPLEILEELLSHIKEGGHLLLMTIFHPSNDDAFFKWWYIRDVTHIGFFNLKTFEYIAYLLNLKIVKHNAKNIILFEKNR